MYQRYEKMSLKCTPCMQSDSFVFADLFLFHRGIHLNNGCCPRVRIHDDYYQWRFLISIICIVSYISNACILSVSILQQIE
mmetsp:Transcript_11462/g.22903  ORF Transcript_11462/g.22903 Transcript_11462/m.22903 type:complete len:81 (-) Transcript_11462:570-812(-)